MKTLTLSLKKKWFDLIKAEILKERFDILCQKESWNEVMEYQEKLMDYNGYWLDSHYYVARWLKAYFGDLLQINI